MQHKGLTVEAQHRVPTTVKHSHLMQGPWAAQRHANWPVATSCKAAGLSNPKP